MKRCYEAIILIFLMVFGKSNVFANTDKTVSSLLDTLDAALEQRDAALDKRNTEAVQLARRAEKMPMSLAKAQAYCQAAQAFMKISSDSVVKYAIKNYNVATKINNETQILYSRMDLLGAYNMRGNLGKSYEVISDIGDISNIPDNVKEKYACHMLDFYLKMQSTNDAYSGPKQSARDAWSFYSQFIPKNSVSYFFYSGVCGGHLDINAALRKLATLDNPSYDYAKLAVAIGREYNREGNADKYYEYLLRSAICDARTGNAEVSSLLFLLQTPLMEKDTKRSYEYVKVLADNVMRYHDMNRALKVVEIQNRINDQFNLQKNHCVFAAASASLLFLIALVFSMIQNRMLRTRKKQTVR